MFEYNKKFWEHIFDSDSEDVEPNRTYYAVGIIAGISAGGLIGWLIGYTVPIAALGGALGMWIGNQFER